MRVFFKNSFYLDKVHLNIPKDAVEISEARYRDLMKQVKEGKIIESDSEGYPVARENTEALIKKQLEQSEKEFNKIVSQPVEFNGLKYLPKNVSEYVGLLPRFFEEGDTLTIWDSENRSSKSFNKNELIELIKVLGHVYEKAYQEKKIRDKKIRGN